MIKDNSEGYLVLGFGKKYILECERLIETIKIYDKQRPFCLLTSLKDKKTLRKNQIFDYVITVDEIDLRDDNSHNAFCVKPRVNVIKYTPFSKTLVLDSDMVCVGDTNFIWNYLSNNDSPFICWGDDKEKNWHWGHIKNIEKKLKLKIPVLHGGILFFNLKSKSIHKFYSDCKYALNKYDQLGFLRNFRNGMTDEVIFAWAMAKNNLKPINYLDCPIISFNINSNIVLPYLAHCRDGTYFNKLHKTRISCCFIHYFLHERSHSFFYRFKINSWYKKIHNEITRKKNAILITSIFTKNISFSSDLKKIKLLLKLPITLVIFCSRDVYDKLNALKIRRNKKVYFIFVENLNLEYILNNIDNLDENISFLKNSFNYKENEVSSSIFNLSREKSLRLVSKLFESNNYLWIDVDQINLKSLLNLFALFVKKTFKFYLTENKNKKNKTFNIIKTSLRFQEFKIKC